MPAVSLDNLPFSNDEIEDDRRNICLGRFMTAWAQVEVVSSFLFTELIEAPRETASFVFDRLGTREQILILSELANRIEDDGTRDAFRAEIDNVQKASEKRNKIVHARWGDYDGEPARYWNGVTGPNLNDIAFETGKAISLRRKNIHTTEDMSRLTDELLTCRDNLQGFLGKVGGSRQDENLRLIKDLMDERCKNMELTRQLWQGTGVQGDPKD